MQENRFLMLVIGLVAALLAAVSWAISAAFYKEGARAVSPFTANLIRIIPPLGVLALLGLLLGAYTLIGLLTFWDMLLIAGSSLSAFVIGDTLYFVTLRYLGVSRGVPITATYPLFVLMLQILLLVEPVHWLMIPAAIIAVGGVAVLSRQIDKTEIINNTVAPRRPFIGIIAALSTAFAWSLSIIMLSQVLQTTNLVLVAVLRLIIALLVTTPFVLLRSTWRQEFLGNQRHWLFLGLGGLVALGVGYLAFATSLQLANTTSATILSSLTPLFALVIGWRGLQERVNWQTALGVIACVTGIVLIGFAATFG
jgi:drug/metabolite transporter (DMT)-like permease